jgi:SAM-dependent methyltransferase
MFGPRNARRTELMAAALGELPPRSWVLEAAVGLGDSAERLRQRGHRVVGVDLSVEALVGARGRTRAHLVLADVTRLPFRPAAFDALSSGETLEHVPDDRAAVRELGRVLRAGARAVVTVPALESLRTFSDNYYQHLRRYSRAELTRLFRDAGFRIERAFFWGFPFVVAYDYLFMLPLNVRRARRGIAADSTLQAVAAMGKKRLLVDLVRRVFAADRFFRWVPLGVGLVLTAVRQPDGHV